MVKVNDKENPLKFSFRKDVFEKFGEPRLFSRGDYLFLHLICRTSYYYIYAVAVRFHVRTV